MWGQRLTEPGAGHRVQVAVLDGEVVGFVTTVAEPRGGTGTSSAGTSRSAATGDQGEAGEPRRDGELLAINVHPDHWGAGAGTALLAAAVDDLTGRGCASAYLWMARGNTRAEAFYVRHGWVRGEAADDVGSAELRGVAVLTVRFTRALDGADTTRGTAAIATGLRPASMPQRVPVTDGE